MLQSFAVFGWGPEHRHRSIWPDSRVLGDHRSTTRLPLLESCEEWLERRCQRIEDCVVDLVPNERMTEPPQQFRRVEARLGDTETFQCRIDARHRLPFDRIGHYVWMIHPNGAANDARTARSDQTQPDFGEIGQDRHVVVRNGPPLSGTVAQLATSRFLRSVGLFAGFSPSQLTLLESKSRVSIFRRGAFVYEESDAVEEVCVVVRGRIAIVNRSPDGREAVVALMGASDVFGVVALFDDHPRTTAARSLETSEIVVIRHSGLRMMLESNPRSMCDVARVLAGQVRHARSSVAEFAFLDVSGRTAKRLLEFAGDRREFQLPVIQTELAGMIGASRERVNKAISEFVRLGWLEQADGQYQVLDRCRLAQRTVPIQQSSTPRTSPL